MELHQLINSSGAIRLAGHILLQPFTRYRCGTCLVFLRLAVSGR